MPGRSGGKDAGERLASLLLAPAGGSFYVRGLTSPGILFMAATEVRRASHRMRWFIRSLAFFGWRPSEAYLLGRKRNHNSSSRITSHPDRGDGGAP